MLPLKPDHVAFSLQFVQFRSMYASAICGNGAKLHFYSLGHESLRDTGSGFNLSHKLAGMEFAFLKFHGSNPTVIASLGYE